MLKTFAWGLSSLDNGTFEIKNLFPKELTHDCTISVAMYNEIMGIEWLPPLEEPRQVTQTIVDAVMAVLAPPRRLNNCLDLRGGADLD